GIQATTYLQVDDGTLDITASEGLEATYVQVNGGTINVGASDDGINATTKSYSVGTPTIEITGGDVTITMGAGDTDALDANGNLYISGGTVSISAQSAFDFDGVGELTGGTVYVNGEQVSTITNSMMGGMGGPMGDMQG
ncbi:MAG: carbohydrate-binding domain-containing protein, partial [Coriobacteriales bacterium]|nr:carbohydrate-binding domain-containing protein [Coriobacteriales bacterium]